MRSSPHPIAISRKKTGGTSIWLVAKPDLAKLSAVTSPAIAGWAAQAGFAGRHGQLCLVPGDGGELAAVLFGVGEDASPMGVGSLARRLPAGDYRFAGKLSDPRLASLGWLLGAYSFDRYKKTKSDAKVRLMVPDCVDAQELASAARATFLARDMINTPANDMGPAEIEGEVRRLARSHDAKVSTIKGDNLLKRNLPMIHAVGRASAHAPRLIDLRWGKTGARKVTLVGKGVAFDTGGLNLKPGSSMSLMKKDMGGAANVLALAAMIMDADLPVRLRVLIPAVENSVSGNSFRPGDVLPSRKGPTVEIGNTDAEGRLILADALALADEERPDLLIDMATLTGAARVALGPDLPPFFTDDQALAVELAAAGEAEQDPLWRLPLWPGYQSMLSSRIADVCHIATGGFAGAVTAALFLSRFVEHAKAWIHLDIFGWVPKEKPWAPIGGEAQGVRALQRVVANRFAK